MRFAQLSQKLEGFLILLSIFFKTDQIVLQAFFFEDSITLSLSKYFVRLFHSYPCPPARDLGSFILGQVIMIWYNMVYSSYCPSCS